MEEIKRKMMEEKKEYSVDCSRRTEIDKIITWLDEARGQGFTEFDVEVDYQVDNWDFADGGYISSIDLIAVKTTIETEEQAGARIEIEKRIEAEKQKIFEDEIITWEKRELRRLKTKYESAE